jgi:putative oxidoreductase
MFPQLGQFTDLSLLLMRLMVAAVFMTSGLEHFRHPKERAKSIGASPAFTMFLGVAEIMGSLGIALGVLTQPAAFGLVLLMLGAIYKKVFVWHIGFWGENTSGWHYDLILILMNVVIACTDGGKYVLWR